MKLMWPCYADCLYRVVFAFPPSDTQEAHCLRQFLKTQDSTAFDEDSDLQKKDMDPDCKLISYLIGEVVVKQKTSISQCQNDYATIWGILTFY